MPQDFSDMKDVSLMDDVSLAPPFNLSEFRALPNDKERKKFFHEYVMDYARSTGKGGIATHTSIMNNLLGGENGKLYKEFKDKQWLKHPQNIQKDLKAERHRNTVFTPNDVQKLDNSYKYYFHKMQLINQSYWQHVPSKQKIYSLMADRIKECMHEFNDPKGEQIDLFAQYIVILEYYRRDLEAKFNKKTNSWEATTRDLDQYMMFAPWEDNGHMYGIAIDKKKVRRPFFYDLINRREMNLGEYEEINPDALDEIINVDLLLDDEDKVDLDGKPNLSALVNAHLRLPWYRNFQIIDTSRKRYMIGWIPRKEHRTFPFTAHTKTMTELIAIPIWRTFVTDELLGRLN